MNYEDIAFVQCVIRTNNQCTIVTMSYVYTYRIKIKELVLFLEVSKH